MKRRLICGLLLAVAAGVVCKPRTERPYFPPVTGAVQAEIQLPTKSATSALADVLKSDSLPVTKVEPRDGYIETAWFDAETRKATGRRRVLGSDVVRVRAWIDPTRQGYSRLTVETVYRPVADPSLAPRELDREVPQSHPVAKQMSEIITELVKLYATDTLEQKPTGP